MMSFKSRAIFIDAKMYIAQTQEKWAFKKARDEIKKKEKAARAIVTQWK